MQGQGVEEREGVEGGGEGVLVHDSLALNEERC